MMRALLYGLLLAGLTSGVVASSGGDPPAREREAARKIYVAKCAKCHKFHEPRKYSEADWDKWMDSMARKSKLSKAQASSLRKYLDEYRAGRLPGKPQDKAK